MVSNRIYNATAENFEELVVQGSASRHILVDFWASWCQPCQVLKPILEALASEYEIILVKINTEVEQALAARMGVRGIPDVRLYRDGAVVDRFTGALPERRVREFLEKHLPSRLDNALDQALALAGSGDEDAAAALFNRLLADNPDSGKVKLAAARHLAGLGRNEESNALLKGVKDSDAEYPLARAMLAMDELRHACESIDGAEGLDRLYAEAACAAMSQAYDRALAGFLEIVRQNKDYNGGAAREAMLTLFDVVENSEMVRQYRRQLAMYLN